MATKTYQTPFIATPAVKSSDLQIKHQCPQCGAPATLLESDRLFACAYCRVRSYLLPREYFQYHLPHKAPAGQEMIYFPYWRFKGMLFSCLPETTHAQFIDTSHQACFSPHFPVSLGLRSQALTLNVVTTDTPGYFVTPQTSISEIMTIFTRRFNRDLPDQHLHQAHIGESVSMIYAPYYLARNLMDAVLNQPVTTQSTLPFKIEKLPGASAATRFQFIPTLCPHCGWDLDGMRDATALTCGHCRSLWQPSVAGFTAIPCAHQSSQSADPVFLPFWRIRAQVNGIDLRTYADLAALANLPKAIRPEWGSTPFFFWSPGFKVRPRVFLRLMRVLSTAPWPTSLERSLPKHTCLPVNLPVEEAAETLTVNLAGLIKPVERKLDILPRIQIKPRKALLVYLPFENRTHEFVNTSLNLAVNKQQLSLAWNL